MLKTNETRKNRKRTIVSVNLCSRLTNNVTHTVCPSMAFSFFMVCEKTRFFGLFCKSFFFVLLQGKKKLNEHTIVKGKYDY